MCSSTRLFASSRASLLLFALICIQFTCGVYGASYYVDSTIGLDTNPGTEASPFLTLEHALAVADADVSLDTLYCNGTFFEYNLETNSSVELIGNPSATLDCSYQGQGLFASTEGTLAIQSFTFTQCSNTALFVQRSSGDVVSVTDSIFSDNISPGSGSHIYIDVNSDVVLSNVNTWGGSSSVHGGAIYLNANGITATGCTFFNERALSNGGALYLAGGDLTLTACTFEQCHADVDGGAIHLRAGQLTVNGGGFSRCDAGRDGGAISSASGVSDINVGSGVIIEECVAARSGGAVYHSALNLNIFDSSTVRDSTAANGGCIYAAFGSVTVSSSLLDNCTASTSGGAIYMGSSTNLVLDNSVVSSSTAITGDGGCIYSACDTVTLSDSQLTACQSGSNGGAVYLTSGTFTMDTSDIIGATTITGHGGCVYGGGATVSAFIGDSSSLSGCIAAGDGGVVYMASGTLTVDNSTASGSGQNGGCVYGGGTSVSITAGSTLDTCTASADGGAVYMANGTLVVDGSTVSGSAVYGGCVYGDAGSVTISGGSELSACAATADGGAVYMASGPLTVDASAVSGSGQNGGCVYGGGTSVSITAGSTLDTCTATADGGAVYMASGTLTVDNSTVSGSGQNGGCVYGDAGLVSITGASTLGTCTASANGGAVYMASGALTVNASSVSGSGQNGGCVYSGADSVLLTGSSTLSGCIASVDGGGVYLASGALTVEDSAVSGSGQNGGCVYGSGTVSILAGSVLDTCSASSSGGGVYLASGTLSLVSSQITSASATNGYGGCVYSVGSSVSVEAGSALDTCTSLLDGGGAYIASGAFLLSESSLSEATSQDGSGGCVYSSGSSVTVQAGSTLSTCAAELHGGGVYVNAGTLTIEDVGTELSNATVTSGDGGCVWTNSSVLVRNRARVHHCAAANGGCVYSEGAATQVALNNRAVLSDCVASGNGGGVYLAAGQARLSSSASIETSSAANGAGLYALPAATSVSLQSSAAVRTSSASTDGGGLYLEGGSTTLSMSGGASVEDCHAPSGLGGGVYSASAGVLTLSSAAEVRACTARTGAGLYLSGGASATLSGAQLVQCNATADFGGAAYVDQGSVQLSAASSVQGCDAVQRGGAFYLNEGQLQMSGGSRIEQCGVGSSGQGGCVYVSGASAQASFSGNGTELADCSAQDGGAVYVADGLATLADLAAVSGGRATRHGAGFYMQAGGRLELSTEAALRGNVADQLGGGCYLEGGLPLLYDARMESNGALRGGAIYQLAGSLDLRRAVGDLNSATEHGGALFAATDARLYLEDCAFERSSATQLGGGLYLDSTQAQVEFVRTRFGSGTAVDGAGVYVNAGQPRFVNSRLVGNHASHNGGGAYLRGNNASFTADTRFEGNCADNEGHAFYVESGTIELSDVQLSGSCADALPPTGQGSITNVGGVLTLSAPCVFRDNVALNGGAIAQSGGGETYLYGCEFYNNTASQSGGALWYEESLLEAHDCLFDGNVAQNGGGGALHTHGVGGNATLIECVFDGNVAEMGSGGAIEAVGPAPLVDLRGAQLRDNRAAQRGGDLALSLGATLLGRDLVVSGSSAQYGGSLALQDDGSDAQLTECSFTGCSASRDGGAFFVDSGAGAGELELREALLQGCSAQNGGALYVLSGSPLLVAARFDSNRATQNGGALSLFDGATVRIDAASAFDGNRAELDGGAVAMLTGQLELPALNLSGNEAGRHGGAIVCAGGRLLLNRTETSLNSAAQDGGALQLTGCELHGELVRASGDRALDGRGGFACSLATVSVELPGAQLSGCEAGLHGGALYQEAGTLSLESALLTACRALNGSGGALHLSAGVSATLHLTEVSACTATVDGGAVHQTDSALSVTESSLTQCVADERGGGFLVNGGTLDLSTSSFAEESASDGGLVYALGGTALTVQHSSVRQCSAAPGDAGALYLDTAACSLTNVSLVQNSAGRDAGAILVSSASTLQLNSELRFERNSASRDAGAILARSSLDVPDVRFESNAASRDGGAIRVSGAVALSLTDTVFTQNSAARDGGALALSGGASLSAVDCVAHGDSATRDGGWLHAENLPPVLASSSLSLSGCRFEESGAAAAGGVAWVTGGLLSAEQCQFARTTSVGVGGAIAMIDSTLDSTLTLTDCLFNETSSSGGGGGGGALYLQRCEHTLLRCEFVDCSARAHGGAVLSTSLDAHVHSAQLVTVLRALSLDGDGGAWHATGGTLQLSEVSMTECSASAGRGGALFLLDALLTAAEQLTLERCEARDGGGLYQSGGTLQLTDSRLQQCSAQPNDGGGLWLGGEASATLLRCEFERNVAASRGGDLLAQDNSTLSSSRVRSQGAVAGSSGGSHHIADAAQATLQWLEVRGARATADGGCVCQSGASASPSSLLDTRDSLLADCAATRGAGLFVSGALSTSTHQNLTLRNNTASSQGGALFVESGAHSLDESLLDACVSQADGGGLYQVAGALQLSQCQVRACAAGMLGGAGVLAGGTLTADQCQVEANRCDADASTFALSGAGTAAQFDRCTFASSRALNGVGGILLEADASLVERDCTHQDEVSLVGGAVALRGGVAQLSNGTLARNGLVDDCQLGGALFVGGGGPHLLRALTFEENAAETGGAMAQNGGLVDELSDSSFARNSALHYGGAVALSDLGRLSSAARLTFTQNSAQVGGAIALAGPDSLSTWSLCSVRDCSAQTAGGGLYVAGGQHLLSEFTFLRLSASAGGGGAAYFAGGNSTLLAVRFDDNQAAGSSPLPFPAAAPLSGSFRPAGSLTPVAAAGGGLFVNGGLLSVQEVHFTVQRAQLGGCFYGNGGQSRLRAGELDQSGVTVQQGAALLVAGGSLALSDSQLYGGTASLRGGAGVVRGGQLRLERCQLHSSQVASGTEDTGGGGLLAVLGSGLLEVDSCGLHDAAADHGAALHLNGGQSTLRNVTLQRNLARVAAVLFALDGTHLVQEALFEEPLAPFRGYVRLASSADAPDAQLDVQLSTVQFHCEGASSGSGSAVWQDGGSLEVSQCALLDCVASERGGAAHLQGGSSAWSGAELLRSSAPLGGALSVSGGQHRFEASSLLENRAPLVGALGGAVHQSGGTLTLDGTLLMNNTAGDPLDPVGAGWDCYLEAGVLSLQGSRLLSADNATVDVGLHMQAGVLNLGGQVTLTHAHLLAGSGRWEGRTVVQVLRMGPLAVLGNASVEVVQNATLHAGSVQVGRFQMRPGSWLWLAEDVGEGTLPLLGCSSECLFEANSTVYGLGTLRSPQVIVQGNLTAGYHRRLDELTQSGEGLETVGHLSVEGSLRFDAGSTLEWSMYSDALFDTFAVSGQLTLGGFLYVDRYQLYFPSIGREYLVFEMGSLLSGSAWSGNFSAPSVDPILRPFFAPTEYWLIAAAPKINGIKMSNSLARLDIGFDRATDRAGLVGQFDAAVIFTDATVALFGEESFCSWKDDFVLYVFLGSGAQVDLEDLVFLRPDNPLGGANDTSSGLVSSSFFGVTPPDNPGSPQATIVAPTNLGPCGDLLLDGTLSYGAGGRPLQYRWRQASGPSVSSALLSANQARISVPGDQLPVGTYRFELQVENFLHLASPWANLTVVKSASGGPPLRVEGTADRLIVASERVMLEASADPLPGCVAGDGSSSSSSSSSSSAVGARPVGILWSVGAGADVPLDNRTRASMSLVLPPYALQPGQSTVLRAEAWYLDEPSLLSAVTVSVRARLHAGVIALIAGGNRTVGVEQPLLLDALASYDLDGEVDSAQLLYSWRCTEPIGTLVQPCRDQTGAEILFEPVGSLLIPGGTLVVGRPYTFHVLVSLPAGDGSGLPSAVSSSTAVTVLAASGGLGPLVYADVVFPQAGRTKVNGDEPLRLSGGALNYTGSPSNLTYQWSLVGGDLVLSAETLLTARNARNLVVRAGRLVAGQVLTWELAVHDAAGVGRTRLAVEVNIPPAAGRLLVDPPEEGVAGQTAFRLEMAEWTDDPEDQPFEYRFAYVDTQGEEVSASLNSWSSRPYDSLVVPGPARNVTLVAYVRDRNLGLRRKTTVVRLLEPVLPAVPDEPPAVTALSESDRRCVYAAADAAELYAAQVLPALDSQQLPLWFRSSFLVLALLNECPYTRLLNISEQDPQLVVELDLVLQEQTRRDLRRALAEQVSLVLERNDLSAPVVQQAFLLVEQLAAVPDEFCDQCLEALVQNALVMLETVQNEGLVQDSGPATARALGQLLDCVAVQVLNVTVASQLQQQLLLAVQSLTLAELRGRLCGEEPVNVTSSRFAMSSMRNYLRDFVGQLRTSPIDALVPVFDPLTNTTVLRPSSVCPQLLSDAQLGNLTESGGADQNSTAGALNVQCLLNYTLVPFAGYELPDVLLDQLDECVDVQITDHAVNPLLATSRLDQASSMVTLTIFNTGRSAANANDTSSSTNGNGTSTANSTTSAAGGVSPALIANLTEPIRITFYHRGNPPPDSARCYYFDEVQDTFVEGGCTVVERTADYTVVEVTHLTNFAMLLDPTGDNSWDLTRIASTVLAISSLLVVSAIIVGSLIRNGGCHRYRNLSSRLGEINSKAVASVNHPSGSTTATSGMASSI
eukprot:CAMPEP_0174246750 /NCGR_PEP_ID=MMETSP0417-20130205/42227_1 /TAXON_ID=242541 /ORGANISM="Mayorella sp, Strain BSH-02190019" /LENGTH=4563 /DNA_ID=CAMNT_0015326603 /DNA_START=250 /DNA_END=13941 /DNA_ORIENTATION=-